MLEATATTMIERDQRERGAAAFLFSRDGVMLLRERERLFFFMEESLLA